MADQDGYPTEEELEKVKTWYRDTPDNAWGLVEYLRSIWWLPDRHVVVYRGRDSLFGKQVWKLTLHTGGWSGNEDIIFALKTSLFWFFHWQMSRRGGHYWFHLPPKRSRTMTDPTAVPGEPVARG